MFTAVSSTQADRDDDLATAPATTLAAAIRAKDLSSRELLDLYLERIDRLGPQLNAVVTLDSDRAREAAHAADEAAARGEFRGPLHGLPFTVKDAIETAGIRSTGGAAELCEHVPSTNAPAVERLLRAGAICFGKTNLPAWSSDFQSWNEMFGATNNPWDLSRVPGGSSGGAAAAVCAGLTSFELGTDFGGSLRIPAHFCGIYGLKPSFGLVPQRGCLYFEGAGSTDVDINVFGPLARSAGDLDLLIGVIAGPSPEHEPAWYVELPAPRITSLAGLRVGVWIDEPSCPVDAEYAALIRRAADRIADAGAAINEVAPPVPVSEHWDLYWQMMIAAASPMLPDDPGEQMSGSHRKWLALERQRVDLRERWATWLRDFDVIICPVAPTAAFPHDHETELAQRTITVNATEQSYLDIGRWCGLVGVTGCPAVVAPVGYTESGLPVGAQLVGSFLADRDVIAVASLLGEVVDGYRKPPDPAPAVQPVHSPD
jgi:amidase